MKINMKKFTIVLYPNSQLKTLISTFKTNLSSTSSDLRSNQVTLGLHTSPIKASLKQDLSLRLFSLNGSIYIFVCMWKGEVFMSLRGVFNSKFVIHSRWWGYVNSSLAQSK